MHNVGIWIVLGLLVYFGPKICRPPEKGPDTVGFAGFRGSGTISHNSRATFQRLVGQEAINLDGSRKLRSIGKRIVASARQLDELIRANTFQRP
jgi:hypothetical protein